MSFIVSYANLKLLATAWLALRYLKLCGTTYFKPSLLQKRCSAIDKQYLYIKQKSETLAVDLNTVAYFEGALKKTIVHFSDSTEKVVGRSLSKIQNMLKNPDFIRIHQSYIINLNSISGFSSKKITVLNRDIPISRKHITATEDAIS